MVLRTLFSKDAQISTLKLEGIFTRRLKDCKGYGLRATLSQVYPYAFCQKLAVTLAEFLAGGPQNYWTDQTFLEDILELDKSGLNNIQEFQDWNSDRLSGDCSLQGLNLHFQTFDALVSSLNVKVTDRKTVRLMRWVDSLRTGSEWILQKHQFQKNFYIWPSILANIIFPYRHLMDAHF
jgi:hypothetical protein